MLILKKLIFAVPFLLVFVLFVSQINPFLNDVNLIFSLSLDILIQLLSLVVYLSLAGLFFVVFATLAEQWKYVLPVSFIASLSPLLFLNPPEAFILTGGFFLSFIITFFFLKNELKSYLSFHATKLLLPGISQIVLLCTLVISAVFYFSANTQITANGFKLPDSIIDTAIKASGGDQISEQLDSALQQSGLPTTLSPELIAAAKQNPALLKQYGIDPKILDTLSTQNQKNPTASPVKAIIEQKVQDIIQPFQTFIPIILTALFFFTISTFSSLFSLINKFLIWLIFYLLEKSGFINFTKEMREVKKLVV